jgi:hypothetical protein
VQVGVILIANQQPFINMPNYTACWVVGWLFNNSAA